MAKTNEVKNIVARRLREALNDIWVGENGGKYYVNVKDGGETVQVAIALTCPKTPVTISQPVGDLDFTDNAEKPVAPSKNTEFTAEEEKTIADLADRLGL